MAKTYTCSDALATIAKLIPRVIEADSGAYICNLAFSEIWKSYDFRETLAVFPPFYIIPGAQDHGAPAVVIPANFQGLREVYLVRLNSSPAYRYPVTPMKDLELTQIHGLPGQMGYEPSTNSFRVFPRVPVNIGCPDYCIQGTYKTRPVKITSANLASTLLPFDDMYLFNMIEVLKWAGWQFSGDQRAGGVVMNNHGSSQYTGQYAAAHDAIDRMAADESLELGEVAIAPASPLAVTSMNGGGYGTWGRLFGF